VVIAIDGPAGAGKSTVAQALAAELRYRYLDSGAMYRSVGLLALRDPGRAAAELARGATIELVPAAPGDPERVVLAGEDVSAVIRTPEVSEAASRVAADPDVREALVAVQRRLLSCGDWVVEGRDIGTVVSPDAAVKVFLTADPDERARRRAAELGADEATVRAEQTLRDERDSTRAHSPLRPASDAILIDTSRLDIADVVARIAALARERRT
jgi:cytidylate kinase